MDSLVSEKIYNEVKNINGIDKIDARSALGMSMLTLTLKTSADVKDVLSEVRNNVNRARLPTDAKTPIITEVETDTNQTFSVYIYAKRPNISEPFLFDRAKILKDEIEKLGVIDSVAFAISWDGWPISEDAGSQDNSYDVEIIIPSEKLKSLGLTLTDISGIIASANIDQPIGNFAISEQKYDFRIAWKKYSSFDFLSTSITLPKWWNTTLWDIATIERIYKNDSVRSIIFDGIAYSYVGLTVNKTDSANIFTASNSAKAVIEKLFQDEEFKDLGYRYGLDIADTIRDDYGILAKEALTTIVLVFFVMYLFVGFKDSLFATLTLPLAFLATFIILNLLGFSLNFLTNFSLILSFGIAVDTIIVIVQWANAKLRVGYEPRTAIMLSLREYAIPIIAWVSTTMVVFVPMMVLPGLLGKFLAYIPITIFWVLASGLVLALTVNSALYLFIVKAKKSYVYDPHATEYATDEEKELLELERIGKEKLETTSAPLRLRLIHASTEWYKRTLRKFLESTYLRRISIIIPVIFLFFWLTVLAPLVGLDLFPGVDNGFFQVEIEWESWLKTDVMAKKTKDIHTYFKWYPEILYTSVSTKGNITSASVQLSKRDLRISLGQRDVYGVEKALIEKLKIYETLGLKVTTKIQEWWPPTSKALWVKLVAEKAEHLSVLTQVANDFEVFLRTVPGAKNVTKTSADTPWQIIFRLKHDLLAKYKIPSFVVMETIASNMNGLRVGSIEDNGNDMDIIIRNGDFRKDARIEDILALPLVIGPNTYSVGTFVESTLENAIASVTRVDGDIQIGVEWDVEAGLDTAKAQNALIAFADSYAYPPGISYKTGWESQENDELISAIVSAFFLSLLVIFAILTLQFNSFSQPTIILYSVIMALPFVMVWLILTGNKFSLPFGIGFIAFTGIAVNHGIILIAAINENLQKWMAGFTALVEAGSSRLEPMILTTLTTALGILPIALRDKFWAWMGFTIIFGIIATTFLTLFVVKWIYYEIYVNQNEWFIKKCYHFLTSQIGSLFTKKIRKIK